MVTNDIITKKTKIKDIVQILKNHDALPMAKFWEIVLWNLLQECDYIRVEGYGLNCNLIQVTEDK